MKHSKLRNKVGKFYNGGKIPTYQEGGFLKWRSKFGMMGWGESDYANFLDEFSKGGDGSATLDEYIQNQLSLKQNDLGMSPDGLNYYKEEDPQLGVTPDIAAQVQAIKNQPQELTASDKLKISNAKAKSALTGIGKKLSGVDFNNLPDGMSEGTAIGMGIASKATTAAVNAIDQATMGDKNFSVSSKAIDTAVHGVSGVLMSSGNPWAMLAGGALEGLNFLTKVGGQTVQGYDVNIENSGYGTMGHQESESGRIWDRWSGATARKLAKRNEQARMALQAAEISEDVKFEQEARMNSVDNVLRNNQIALAGGIDTNLLGA